MFACIKFSYINVLCWKKYIYFFKFGGDLIWRTENYVKFGEWSFFEILAGVKFGEFRQNTPNSRNLIPAKINPIKVSFLAVLLEFIFYNVEWGEVSKMKFFERNCIVLVTRLRFIWITNSSDHKRVWMNCTLLYRK